MCNFLQNLKWVALTEVIRVVPGLTDSVKGRLKAAAELQVA
jgi:hypothetical protein